MDTIRTLERYAAIAGGCDVADIIPTLRRMGACDDALEWLESLPPETPGYDVWSQCARGDWLIWLAEHVADEATIRLIACDCAADVLPDWERWAREHAPAHLAAPRQCIDTVRAYVAGDATWADAKAARDAARAARDAAKATDDATRAAARDALDAALAVEWAAEWPARNAADTAWHASQGSTCSATLGRQARIARRHVRWADVQAELERRT